MERSDSILNDAEGLTASEEQDLLEFESRHLFTTKPQPIIKLLGAEVRQIKCGSDHVILVSKEGTLFTWGSNSNGQLGINKKQTQKKIEYTSFVAEDQIDQGLESPKDGAKPGSGANHATKRVQGKQKDTQDQFPSPTTKNNELNKLDNNMLMEDGDEHKDEPASPAPHRSNITLAGLVQVTKTVKKHFVGIPTQINSIQGKIEHVSTGDNSTYAIVKI